MRLKEDCAGPILQQFKSFASFVDYEMRGDLIGQQSEIRSAHNSLLEQILLTANHSDDDADKQKDGDAYHFIAYVPMEKVSTSWMGCAPA